MLRKQSTIHSWIRPQTVSESRLAILCRLLFLCWCGNCAALSLSAAQPGPAPSSLATNATPAGMTNTTPGFNVRAYAVDGTTFLPADALAPLMSKHTGTNLSIQSLVEAASAVLAELRSRGASNQSVVIGPQEITNGIVKMHVIQAALSQIVVSGRRYPIATNTQAIVSNPTVPVAAAATNAVPPEPPPKIVPNVPVSPEAMALANETLHRKILDLEAEERRARMLPNSKTNFPPATNGQALADLQTVYRDRGYATVSVGLPKQTPTNGVLTVRVFEGRISDIIVANNHHFSSNNVMRALPGLHTNMLLVSQVFQAELDRANAHQDRQIYPELQPGPEENTTVLRLKVEDRLPLHAKVELNNQSSPGTPDLRLNSSAVFNNLWQLEHSLGVQYSFSPEAFKMDTPQTKWAFYDQPLVANYSGFYRVPFGGLTSVGEEIAARPGSFGYDEATRKFHLPPPSSRPEVNFYANRATIDTGLMTTFSGNLFSQGGQSLDRKDVQQDYTVNNGFGSRLTLPLAPTEEIQSSLSGGFDYKTYDLASHKTNIFAFSSVVVDNSTSPPQTNINHSIVTSPVGVNGLTTTHLEYLPLALRYDASLRDSKGVTAFGLGLGANGWYSGSSRNVQNATGSAQSTGHWVVLNPTISRDFSLYKEWVLSAHAEAQWASEPLVSNEQFGLGGVANIRGYQEGEVFGDTGWRLNLDLKMPAHQVGIVYGKEPLMLRPSVYMDYGRAFLLDPQGRVPQVSLWGAGFGTVATIGPHWEGRLLFSWPLIGTSITRAGQPRFNFSLTAQF
ncbi:MAG: hypothetical protein JWR69_4106 [Pedosphaera sp.]|nr:hypothetical protein [Pedosphaera sp.]